jgi:hypothetical protein
MLEVWIQCGIGTEIELNISATSAYAEPAPVGFAAAQAELRQ